MGGNIKNQLKEKRKDNRNILILAIKYLPFIIILVAAVSQGEEADVQKFTDRLNTERTYSKGQLHSINGKPVVNQANGRRNGISLVNFIVKINLLLFILTEGMNII